MIHGIQDTDTHFIIDGSTRLVKNEADVKSMLVQYDHNSEIFTFDVPRFVDGHDLLDCNTVRAHYINLDKSKRMENIGVDEITDLTICPDDEDMVCCSWRITEGATRLAGSLHFVIQFACTEGEKVLYSWNTAKYTNITISDGINNGEREVGEHFDILKRWEDELKANHIVSIDQTQFGDGDGGENVWTATFGDGRESNFVVKNGSRGEKSLIGSIETIEGDILNFSIGTKEAYNALPAKQKESTLAFFTDEPPVIDEDGNLTCQNQYQGEYIHEKIVRGWYGIIVETPAYITSSTIYIFPDDSALTCTSALFEIMHSGVWYQSRFIVTRFEDDEGNLEWRGYIEYKNNGIWIAWDKTDTDYVLRLLMTG